MANRKRPIRVRTYLTEEELKMVHKRMAQMGTTNREAYMRKMALDGYILRLEIPELKEYVAMQRVHSKRFNEIAKRVNETGRLYPEDVAEMKEMISKSTPVIPLTSAISSTRRWKPSRKFQPSRLIPADILTSRRCRHWVWISPPSRALWATPMWI